MDHDRAVVHGSMVDHGRRQSKGSPEHGLGVAPVSGSSPAMGEKEEEASGVPTMGEGGWCGAGGRTATVDRNSGGLELGGGEWSHGEVKQRVGGGAVGCYGARSSFYRAGGWEGRRCGEGNGRRRRCAIKAFKPSVLGGERRGEWGVKRGQNAAPFPREEGSSGQRERAREVAAAAPSQASGGRRRPGSLTGWACLSVRGRQRGRLGRKGREGVGHDW
jgi:hypothetical protein